MGKILVVTSGKGGTGKSTFAIGIGAALCRYMKSVLLIDLDEGLRSLDSMLGLTENMIFDIGDVLAGNVPIAQAIQRVEKPDGLYLLGAPQKHGSIKEKELFSELVHVLAEQYDYVIVDSPAGIGRGFDIAISVADLAVVVTGPDRVSLRDAGLISQILDKKGIQEKRLVINRIKVRLILGGILPNLDDSIDTSGLQLLGIVPEDETLLVCAAKGVAPEKGKASAAFDRIASRLEGEIVPLPKNIKSF